MSAAQKRTMDNAVINLIRYSTCKLTDDTRIRLTPPIKAIKPATATIAEILASRS